MAEVKTKSVQFAVVFLFVWSVCGASVAAGDRLEAAPAAAEIDHVALREATRAAVACAAEFLLDRAADSKRGLIVAPAVKGHARKAYTVRYTRKIVEEPVYEWDYEEVFVTRGAGQSSAEDEARELAKRRRRIPGSQRQVGTRKVEREVADPQGDIVRDYPETRVAEQWQYGFLGQNALALYALVEAGVPENHPTVSSLAGTLRDIVLRYGCPDATWDLAWLTAVFSRLSDPSFEQVREWLIHKLLDGQIADGSARGMWGPISVNTALLAAMIQVETRLNGELDKRRAAAKERPNSKVLQERVDELEAARQAFARNYLRVSRQGLRFEDVLERWTLTSDHDVERITAPGLPFYVYNETVADMESSALALFALRMAGRRGHLPKKVWRPVVSRNKPLLPSESVSAILARAAAALRRAQQRDGTWFEENLHQPVEHFRALDFRALSKDELFDLASEQTALASVQALQALRSLADMVGVRKVAGRYGPVFTRGRAAALTMAERWLDGKSALSGVRQPRGGAYMLMASGLERPLDGVVEDRGDIRSRLAYRILTDQNADGSWGEGERVGYSSGLMAYWEERYRREHDEKQADLPAQRRTLFDADAWWETHVGQSQNLHRFEAALVDTAYAMLYLASGLRNPVAGYVMETPRAPFPVTLAAGLRAMGERHGFAARCIAATPNTPVSAATALPALFVDARSPLTQPGIRGLIQAYLKGTGLLIVETPDANSAKSMEQTLLSLLGAKSRAAAAPADLVPESAFRGTVPALNGIYDGQGRLAALFLPARGGVLAGPILQGRLPKNCFEPGYALDTGDTPPVAARVAALARLTGKTTAPAAVRTTRGTASADPPAWDAVPAAPADQGLADDEVW